MLRSTHALTMLLSLVVADCSRGAETDGCPAPEAVHAVPIHRVPIAGLPSFGNARGLVTLVVFTDYECPFCRKLDRTIARLRSAYGDELRVVIAERPLSMHRRARPAALAALAAAEQGKLEAMHDALFVASALDEEAVTAIARGIGLDLARFAEDKKTTAPRALAKSEQIADGLGVSGTPTMFVNGRLVVGAQPFEALRLVVDERLAAARELVAKGIAVDQVYEATMAGK
jgi:protein-disulfide isomerase